MHASTVGFARPALGHLPAATGFTRPNAPTRRASSSAGSSLKSRETDFLSGKSILVVEDDVIIRTLVHRILVKAGYQVDIASNGEEGWEKLNQRPYDLLITDQEMPRLTGLKLIERARHGGFSLPIILMSGAVVTGALASEASDRPDVFLPKPFSLPTLISEVENRLIAA